MQEDKEVGIVLFDGVCHLCDGAVRFIVKRERNAELKFAPLQSDSGNSLLEQYGYPSDYLDGLILIESNRVHDRSCACLRIAGKLNFPWNLLFPLLIIPKPLRDFIYGMIASVRYRWFGKKESCSLPQGEDLSRFL
jgi:predicted DCC family thiol-disulfide oxidoreductase YuxK